MYITPSEIFSFMLHSMSYHMVQQDIRLFHREPGDEKEEEEEDDQKPSTSQKADVSGTHKDTESGDEQGTNSINADSNKSITISKDKKKRKSTERGKRSDAMSRGMSFSRLEAYGMHTQVKRAKKERSKKKKQKLSSD